MEDEIMIPELEILNTIEALLDTNPALPEPLEISFSVKKYLPQIREYTMDVTIGEEVFIVTVARKMIRN